jgi:hypothetical protein
LVPMAGDLKVILSIELKLFMVSTISKSVIGWRGEWRLGDVPPTFCPLLFCRGCGVYWYTAT